MSSGSRYCLSNWLATTPVFKHSPSRSGAGDGENSVDFDEAPDYDEISL
ncbi:hypothetical protein [Pseudohalioglobus lutimaris]|nr:hypothetical protein [Pseudohalioglobus lutimaris]